MASAKPVANFAGVVDAVSTVVSKPIQRTLTPGQMAVELLSNKGTPDDRKVFVLSNADRDYFRALMFATDAVDGTVLATETLIGTLTRVDSSKESGQFSFNEEAALAGENAEVALRLSSLVAGVVTGDTSKMPPSRSMESIVNAIVDVLSGDRESVTAEGTVAQPESAFAIVIDQTGDGDVKVYNGAIAGTLLGKLSDIETVAEDAASVGSLW